MNFADDVVSAAARDELPGCGLDLQHTVEDEPHEAGLIRLEIVHQARRFPQRLEERRRLKVDDLDRAVLVEQGAVQGRIVREERGDG